jgi:hypothetical protein
MYKDNADLISATDEHDRRPSPWRYELRDLHSFGIMEERRKGAKKQRVVLGSFKFTHSNQSILENVAVFE